MVIRHRREKATIYGKRPDYPFYRLSYYAAGKRKMRHFAKFSEAKAVAERIVRELADGSPAAALSADQSRDAIAALQRLESFRLATGRQFSLLAAVSEFVEVSTKLGEHTLGKAADGFLRSVATVTRKDLGEAVDEFLKSCLPRTKATEGQRAQISGKYAYNREIQLRRFATAFTGTAVCDLGREHLDGFIGGLSDFSAKSRNHYRAVIRQFLQWSIRKDYLSATHRLGEADGMNPERANTAEVHFYTPAELAALLAKADGTLRPLLAIGGLAGLRTAELLRLDWADVWRVPGHLEVTARKSKTRQRRLVEICPALAAWLEDHRKDTSGKIWPFHEITFQEQSLALAQKAEVPRKQNGLRHSFCSFHFALQSNENLTAAQAGNSPAMIHAHYKGLATKAEAEKWFAVRPPEAANNVIQLATAATP